MTPSEVKELIDRVLAERMTAWSECWPRDNNAEPTKQEAAYEQGRRDMAREWGQHKRSCDLMDAFIDGKHCTCGFSDALRALTPASCGSDTAESVTQGGVSGTSEPQATWQLIDTAPRDGSHFLGYSPKEIYDFANIKETWMGKYQEGSIGFLKWQDGDGPRNYGWGYIERDCCFSWSPTHWMPLPAPPHALIAQEGET